MIFFNDFDSILFDDFSRLLILGKFDYHVNKPDHVYTQEFLGSLHDDFIKWTHFRITGHLCGEFTGPRWFPHTKASDAEFWCFLWSAPE